MSKLFNLVCLAALVVCLYFMVNVSKGGCPSASVPGGSPSYGTPRVEVSASESKKFVADKFIAGFELRLYGKNKDELFKRMSDRRSVIYGNVKTLDIPESNIEQNSIDFSKEWSYDNGKREFAGYRASQFFNVTVDRKSDVATLVSTLASEPDIEIHRTAATLKDENSVQSGVIKAAGAKAMKKAESYAESVGAKVGKVLLVTSEGDGVFYSEFPVARHSKAMMMNSMDMAAGAPAESIIADSVEVSASVRVVVELK